MMAASHNGLMLTNEHPGLIRFYNDKNEKLLAQAQAFLTAQRAKYEREKLTREKSHE